METTQSLANSITMSLASGTRSPLLQLDRSTLGDQGCHFVGGTGMLGASVQLCPFQGQCHCSYVCCCSLIVNLALMCCQVSLVGLLKVSTEVCSVERLCKVAS